MKKRYIKITKQFFVSLRNSLGISKRGQVTIVLIIILIVLLGFGLLIYYLTTSLSAEKKPRAFTADSVSDYVTECLAITGQNALYLLGKQGGYIRLEEPYFEDLGTAYLFDGTNKVPAITEIEASLGGFIDANIDDCLNDFSVFTGTRVEKQSPSTAVTINAVDVTFLMAYPIKVIKEDKEITVSEFLAVEDLNLKRILWLANNIVQAEVDHGMVDIDALKSEPEIIFFPYERTLICQIVDDSYKVENIPYMFRFANKELTI